MKERWYVGAQNDALFIINRPPRPSNDDVVPDRDVRVIAKVYNKADADRIAEAVNRYADE